MTFDRHELKALRDTANETMQDTAILYGRVAIGADDYGETLYRENVVETPCGFNPAISREVVGEAQVPMFDARARLPLTVVITGLDRLEIVARMGELLAPPLQFELIGDPLIGPTAQVLFLRTQTKE